MDQKFGPAYSLKTFAVLIQIKKGVLLIETMKFYSSQSQFIIS